jgi:hypothetical protein
VSDPLGIMDVPTEREALLMTATRWTCAHATPVSCPGGIEWPTSKAATAHCDAMYIERLQAARRGEGECPCHLRSCRLDHGNRIR